MFGNKPFGATGTSGFGSFSTTTNTFGQQPTFGANTSTGTFGSTTNTLFGGATQQSNPFQTQSTGLFGTTPQSNVTFGGTSTFGAQPSSVAQQPTFGNTSFFGNTAQNSMFSQNKPALPTFSQSTSTFPTSTTFGQPTLFGQQNTTSTLFGSGTTNQPGTSVFSTPFQQQQPQLMPTTNGTVVKFKPVTGTENVLNTNSVLNTRNNCICSMKEYENKSMEELRYEDYLANRNGFSNTTTTNLFGNTTGSIFENKNIFSSNTNTATVFPSNTTNLFGQPKPVGFTQTDGSGMSSVFGTNTGTTNQLFGQTQMKPTFGTTDTSNQQQNTSLFGGDQNKPFGGLAASTVTTSTSTLMPNTFGSTTFNNPQASTFGQSSLLQSENKPTTFLFGQNAVNPTSGTTGAFSFGMNQPAVSNTTNSLLQQKPLFQSSGIGGTSGGFMSSMQNPAMNTFGSSLNTSNTTSLFGNSNNNQQMSLMPQMSTTLNQPSIFSSINSLIDSSKDSLLMRMKLSPFGFEGFDLNTKTIGENKENSRQLRMPQDKVLKELLNERQQKMKTELSRTPNRGFKSIVKAFFGDDNNNNSNNSIGSNSDSPNNFEERRNKKALRIKVDVKNFDLSDSLKKLMPEKKDIDNSLIANDSIRSCNNNNDDDDDLFNENKANVVLDREDYYTVPTISEMNELYDSVKGTCLVSNLTIGRYNYGNVYFPGTIDVTNMNFDKIIEIRKNEVLVYPNENDKPTIGKGLNRKALITIDNVWPIDPNTLKTIKDENAIYKSGFINDLKERCVSMNVDFVEYRYESGSWVFRTDHF